MKTTEENNRRENHLFLLILIAVFAAASVLLFSYFRRLSYAELLRRGVTVLLSTIVFDIVFSLRLSKKTFFFSNETKAKRSLLLYFPGILVAVGMSVLPVTGWLYPVIFLLLALTSESVTGIVGGMNLLLITALLSEVPSGVFALYFLLGAFAVLMFTDFEHAYSGKATLFGFILFYLFMQACLLMFYVTGAFRWESVLVPVANVLLHVIFLLIIIRQVNLQHLEVRSQNYAGLGDQTGALLEELKEEEPSRYYQAIHAAHFSMRLAKEIKADSVLCRIGAYYAWMPEVYKDPEERERIYAENSFPAELCDLIEEVRIQPFSSTEAFLIALSHELAQSLLSCEGKDRAMVKSYGGIVEKLLKQHYLSDDLSMLDLSFASYAVIEKTLVNEKKYLAMMEVKQNETVHGE